MTKELIEETKKAIGYRDTAKSCKTCKHSKEEEDPHLDRSWNWKCHVSNICSFTVKPEGTCNLHENK